VFFAQPVFLLLLIAVAALAAWEWRRAHRQAEALRFSDTSAAAAVPTTLWVRLRHLPAGLRLGALTLGVLALARPQTADVLTERTAEGIDIMLVLDVSTSMLAQDFPPNRFEAAKAVAAEFVSGRHSDRIGVVVFAIGAHTYVPLTTDHTFLRGMIGALHAGMLEDGTAIGLGLATAVARLRQSEAESRVVILLTDGQNNRGEIDPLTAADVAAAFGARVYTIGIGGEGVDAFGRQIPEHLRSLIPVDPGVDEASLRAVAERTGGAYFHASNRDALTAIYERISDLETTEFVADTYLDVKERYAAFLWAAFLLILLELVLSSTRLRLVP
jgi:Ca-activated chloride channel homolog